MRTFRTLLVAALALGIAATARAANIVWVSDQTLNSSTGAFPDQGFVDLLTARGHSVTRYNPPNAGALPAADVTMLNAADLVILGRSILSAAFDTVAETQPWNVQVTKPLLCMNGFLTRQNRLGWFAGNLLPDSLQSRLTFPAGATGSYMLGATAQTGGTTTNFMFHQIVPLPGGGTDQGMSVNTNALIAGGTVVATTTDLASGAFIVTLPATTTIPAGSLSAGQALGGFRMQFLGGNRESATSPGNSVASAGFENLTPEGEEMFLRAVDIAVTGGKPPIAVTNTNDAGLGSLRQAFSDAAASAGADVITFAAALSGQTIALATFSSPVGIGNTALVVNDAGGVTVDASALPGGIRITDGTATSYRLFYVESGSSLTLRGLTLADGGGADFGDVGGGIINRGTLALERCTLTGQTAGTNGGAIFNGGPLTLTHCTLFGNSSGSGGGAIFNLGPLALTHCTLSGNTGNGGGGIFNDSPTTLTHCIVAGNTATNGAGNGHDITINTGTLTRVGANIVQDVQNVGTLNGPAHLTADPRLAPLASHGGPTQTMPPLPGSPALDAASALAGLTTDQRGFARNRDSNDVAGALPDIGAVEVRRTLITTAADELDTPTGAATSLREALRDGADHAFFSSAVFTGGAANTITLDAAKGQIIVPSVFLSGANVGGVTIDGGPGTNRIFSINDGSGVTLHRLTLTGGNGAGAVGSGSGGAIYAAAGGTLSLTDCTVAGNTAPSTDFATGGGGIYSEGALTLTRCTFSGNSAAREGGAVRQRFADFTATHCTFGSNTAGTGGGVSTADGGGAAFTHCTFALNNGGFGGGLYSYGKDITLTNCVLAGNTSERSVDLNNEAGTLTLVGANLVPNSVMFGVTPSGPAFLTGAAALSALGDFGGTTRTFYPQPGSAALGMASVVAGLTTDQRGVALPATGRDLGALQTGVAIPGVPLVVTTTTDDFDGIDNGGVSLREVVALAPAGSTITFAAGVTGPITLGSEIVLTRDVTIEAGAGSLTIDGGPGSNRIFSVSSGQVAVLKNLTLTGGNGIGAVGSGSGGAIYAAAGSTLTLTDCTVTGNTAPSTASAIGGGGGIYSEGALTLTRCTFSGNSAAGEGGAVRQRFADFTATHCTFGSNTAGTGGGVSTADGGGAAFTHCTFALNNGGFGGGLYSYGKDITLTNCVLAGNTSERSVDLNNEAGTLTLVGANLVPNSVMFGVTPSGPAFLTGAAALSALGDFGGTTRTFYPQPGSAALGMASVVAGLTTDQRGVALPATGRDLGALQTGVAIPGVPLVVTTTADDFDGLDTNGVSLREVVALAPAGSTVTFAAGVTGPITLGSEIVLARNVTIEAGAGGLTIDGGPGTNRIFSINDGSGVTLHRLTLTGGNGAGAVGSGSGGAIYNAGTLTLERCTLTGNAASGGGALASIGAGASALLQNCTLAGNTAVFGGGIYSEGAALSLTHCTIASNTGTGGTGGIVLNNGTAFFRNTLVATNVATGTTDADLGGGSTAMTVQGANLIGNNNGNYAATFPAGPLAGTAASPLNPRLAPLTSNGGPTGTMSLLPASPALDAAIVTAGLDTDQRGFHRSRDGNAVAGALPDIGAYEAQAAPFSIGFNLGDTSVSGGDTLAAGEIAGAPGFTQGSWNHLAGPNSGLPADTATRTDATGATVPGLALWWRGPNTWRLGGTADTPDKKLMFGYLDSNATGDGTTAPDLFSNAAAQPYLAVAGLPAAAILGGYRVLVYADTDNTLGRISRYWLTSNRARNPASVGGESTLTDSLFSRDTANFGGTYTRATATADTGLGTPGGNYFVFENVAEAGGFIVRGEEGSLPATIQARAPLNAVQIVRNEIIVVTTAADENDPGGTLGAGISLREALRDGAPGMGILFDGALSGATIALGSELLVTRSVVVDAGSLAGGVTLHGGDATRLLRVSAGVTCTLHALTLANGRAADTGVPLYGFGSGIHNSGRLTVNRCTLTGNVAPGFKGGGIYNELGSSLAVNQSTFTANSAAQGGGIFNSGAVTVNQSTLTENSAPTGSGGGIYNDLSGSLTLTNSILAGNSAQSASSADFENDGTLTRVSANLVQAYSNAGNDSIVPAFINAAPLLAPLGNYGGPTPTRALLPGSPARNAAVASAFPTDQRGFPIVGVRDIGAYEAGTLDANFAAYIWETLPATATVAQHGSAIDFDGDGENNAEEFLAQTGAADSASVLRLSLGVLSGANLPFNFPSVVGRNYTVESTTDLVNWFVVGVIPGTGSQVFNTISPVQFPHYFIRLRVGP